jgi:NADPH-dependent ferric siderophore reductase
MEQFVFAPPQQELAATVVAHSRVAAHTYHVRLRGESLRHLPYLPGYTVDVQLGGPSAPPRKYSVWNYEPETGLLDLAVCTFSGGAGAHWVQGLRVGAAVLLRPPRGKLTLLDGYNTYYLLGDVTALAHLYELHRNLRLSQEAVGFVYAHAAADVFADLDGSFPLPYQVVHPLRPAKVVAQVRELLPPAPGHDVAYITGEPATCVALTHLLREEWGLPSQQVRTKPFWR